jgi:hypothetical protein
MRQLTFIPMAALALSALLSAAADGPDPRSLGPQVGQAVPEFVLTDQHGATRTLKSTFGPNGVVLVFFRSADW